MPRETLKGAAAGAIVMSVGLVALSLIDPQQPYPVAVPALSPTTQREAPQMTAPQDEALAALPSKAAAMRDAEARAPELDGPGADAAPEAADPPSIAPPEATAPGALALEESAAEEQPALAEESPPHLTRDPALLPEADLPAGFGPMVPPEVAALSAAPEEESKLPEVPEPASAAPILQEKPALRPPATEVGLPGADPAGDAPERMLSEVQALEPTAEAEWNRAGAEASLLRPAPVTGLRPSDPGSMPVIEAAPQAIMPPISTVADPGLAQLAETGPKLPEPSIAPAVPGAPTAAPVTPEPEGLLSAPETPPVLAPALDRFAAEVTAAPELPLLAIVLQVDGDAQVSVAELSALPYRFSILLDPNLPEAPALMRAYRAAGHEVIALAPVVDGASPETAASALELALSVVPESVAVMEDRPGAMSSDPAVAARLAAELAREGQGVLVWAEGLNPVEGFAGGAEPPLAAVTRVIDAQGQNSRALLRFVEQAAARAGQAGSNVVLARLRPEMLEALSRFQDSPRASRVALVPVSVILKGN